MYIYWNTETQCTSEIIAAEQQRGELQDLLVASALLLGRPDTKVEVLTSKNRQRLSTET